MDSSCKICTIVPSFVFHVQHKVIVKYPKIREKAAFCCPDTGTIWEHKICICLKTCALLITVLALMFFVSAYCRIVHRPSVDSQRCTKKIDSCRNRYICVQFISWLTCCESTGDMVNASSCLHYGLAQHATRQCKLETLLCPTGIVHCCDFHGHSCRGISKELCWLWTLLVKFIAYFCR